VTDGFEQWVVSLPVWFQTPLVLVALALVALAVAAALLWVLFRVLPRDDSEHRVFGEHGGGGDAE
jgi:Kef-type K+ transport system membrane component KefB